MAIHSTVATRHPRPSYDCVEIHRLPRHMRLSLTVERITPIASTIQHLDIHGCRNISNEMLQDAFQPGTSRQVGTLEWLDVSWTKVIWFPSTLSYLDIYRRRDITTEMLAHLVNCKIIR